jgi:molybdenum cofactor synthesis domain-containing protein
MPKFDLLRKTEIRIENIVLRKANLTDIAAHVAEVLGLNRSEVVVVDYRDEAMTLDVLNTCVNAHNIVGKNSQLLSALSGLPGVSVGRDTSIHSDGMLGWIAMDEGAAKQALHQSEQMVSEMLRNISKRVIVFSTGGEVADGQIEDTNTPVITQCLAAEGYKVTQGPTLKDDELIIAARLREAADYGGYGLIMTTGGVGAEDKDHTVEAVKALDPEAATPYICRFEIGTGRHVKDGIKIAVGQYNGTLIVALPGPNDEVKASLDVLVDGLKTEQAKEILADNIATNLRDILREKMSRHHKH